MDHFFIREVRLQTNIAADSYLSRLPVVQHLARGHVLRLSSPITFFVGENGTGKSTLLEAIAVASGFNAEGGTRNFSFSTSATHSKLHEHLAIARSAYPKDGFFLRAESFYNAASYIDSIYENELSAGGHTAYGSRSLHQQSHGESFLALVENRFGANGLYLLDEPESALSPTRLMTLMVLLHRLIAAGAQFIIATHSPILMAYPNSNLFLFDAQGIRTADYRDTEHYQLTRRFLENPEKMLHYLLNE